MKPSRSRILVATATLAALAAPAVRAAERVTLRNGSQLDCTRHEADGDRVRLYLVASTPGSASYIDLPAEAIVASESIPDPQPAALASAKTAAQTETQTDTQAAASEAPLSAVELHQMLARAGAAHNVDSDLIASVIQAESAFNPRAVSRAGAQGLMQLMPGTASTLGVRDSFAPEQNVGGGSAYLDQLLTRYRDNLALALAAYNAGPAAVDRYHGIPPYAETRAYVARVIRAFNRRKLAALAASVR